MTRQKNVLLFNEDTREELKRYTYKYKEVCEEESIFDDIG